MPNSKTLQIKNLQIDFKSQPIVSNLNLTINPGETQVIMGPNGSGKSTLAKTIMGHPSYKIKAGTIEWGQQTINKLSPDQRAKLGIFLSFQTPTPIPGVTLFELLRLAQRKQTTNDQSSASSLANKLIREKQQSLTEFQDELSQTLADLKLNSDFLERYLNDGLSGGEQKKSEIVQLANLKPNLIILDETDSGLDVDALKIVATNLKKWRQPETSLLIITHHQQILKYLKPDLVHIMKDGQIVATGKNELLTQIDQQGYQQWTT